MRKILETWDLLSLQLQRKTIREHWFGNYSRQNSPAETSSKE